MFILVFVIILILIYLIIQKDNRVSSKYLAATLIVYIIAIFAMILYLSKDTYYYNIVNNYFSLPKGVWRYLMFVNIPQDVIIRLLNLSSLAVVFFGYCFSVSYQEKSSIYLLKKWQLMIPAFLIIQFFIYDPLIQYHVYNFVYPNWLSLEQIYAFKNIFHMITVIINNGIILYSILRLCLIYKKVYFLHFLRSYLIGEGICYTGIMISYITIFWFSPGFLIKISKIADFTTYSSVPLSKNQFIYTIFPYSLIVTELLCAFCIYEIVSIKRKMMNKEFTITKQIDAADTTSKSFCHYMKNEIIAIQSEVELLHTSEENENGIQEILNRCNNLYERLDTIHRSTKNSNLDLVETDITKLVSTILEHMNSNLRNCQTIQLFEEDIPNVMIDSIFFEQAVKNIIENAIDSMETLPEEQRKLTIKLESVSNWIILSIQDTGVGIKDSNIKNIFTPLYSSKPIAKHWGIGLALTHRIIMAHEGKIEVESHENVGTNFKIFLPNMYQYVS
ncbi:MAG: HAMP domain-containing sensor histidine kinase [Mobilitalea sp.]